MKKLLFALLLGLVITAGLTGNHVNKSASGETIITSVSDPGDGGVGGGH